MITWKIYQFKNIVNSFLEDCDLDMQEAIEGRLYSLIEKGNMCTMPVSEPLRDGLFALRAKTIRQQARLIYYFRPNKAINFVHVFYKTTRNVLPKDIKIAKQNKKIIEEGAITVYGIDLTH
jgi:hypothetical protein